MRQRHSMGIGRLGENMVNSPSPRGKHRSVATGCRAVVSVPLTDEMSEYSNGYTINQLYLAAILIPHWHPSVGMLMRLVTCLCPSV